MRFRLRGPAPLSYALSAVVATTSLVAATPQIAGAQATPTAPTTAPPAATVTSASDPEGLTIASIDIKGLVNTNIDVVRSLLSANNLKEDQPFHASDSEPARTAIRNQGLYSDAFLTPVVTPDGKVALTVQVVENPVVKIVHIRTTVPVKGKNTPNEAGLLPTLQSKPGLVLNDQAIRADARKIQEAYRAAGYDAFMSQLEDIYDAKAGILTFTVTITTINDIQVTGLHKTKPIVVLRELKLKKGDPINREQIQKAVTRVYDTNLFSNVENPTIEPVDEGRANLVIPVTEQRTGQVQVGFGYSAQQRLTGTLEVSENNFRGMGEGVSASWTVGGVVARSQFDLGYSQPWLDKNNTSLSIDLYDKIDYLFNRVFTNAVTSGTSSNPYYNERKGATFTLSRPVTDTTRVFATLRTENVTANNLFSNYQNLTVNELSNIQGSLVQDGMTNSVLFRSLTNTRDNDRDPVTGLFFQPTLETGYSRFHYQNPKLNPYYLSPVKTPGIDKVISMTQYNTGPFAKLNIDTRRYFNLSGTPRTSITEPKRVIATKLLLGTATGNIGFSEQYFMGGADNLRGYPDDRFWGDNLFLSSTELRQPFGKDGTITGVLFVDIGDAWGATGQNKANVAGFGQHSNFSPHFGYGPGIRIKTPVGPVRLDLGFGETTRTHFSIGNAF